MLAILFSVEDIAKFLIESYGSSSMTVVIYEAEEPNYVIGSSTGSDSAKLFLTSDLSKLCPVNSGTDIPCTPVRVPMSELSGDPMDSVLVRSYQLHEKANYPQELLAVKHSGDTDSEISVSQSTSYEQEGGAQLRWRVIITSPGQKSSSDAITVGNQLFPVIIVIGGLGLVGCLFLIGVFYSKRKEKAVIYADWRFTLAFIMGCVLLNGSTFTLLGPNTDSTCLLRRWTFHLFFVMALAPLIIKVWRIKQLVGMTNMRRNAISNYQVALYTLPMIMTEVVILLISTFLDPPKQTEIIENSDGAVLQRIICDSETSAFFIVQVVFEAGVVLVGCILAYLTRNMDSNFGESKQLIFAIYNIALISIVILIVISVNDMDENGKSVLQAIGVFWGTVFSAAAFVIPRMVQLREQRGQGRHNVQISGLSHSTAAYESNAHNSHAGNQAISGRSNESGNSLEKAEKGLHVSNESNDEDEIATEATVLQDCTKSILSATYNEEDELAPDAAVLQESTPTAKDDPNVPEPDDIALVKPPPSAEENGLRSEETLVESINNTPAKEHVQLATELNVQDSTDSTPTARDDVPAEGTVQNVPEPERGSVDEITLEDSTKSSPSADEELSDEEGFLGKITGIEQEQLEIEETFQYSIETTATARGQLLYEGLTQEIAHRTSVEEEDLLDDLLADETEQERGVISETAKKEIHDERKAESSVTAHREDGIEEKSTERPTTEEKPVVIKSAPVEETPKKESARDRKRTLERSLQVSYP